MTTPNNILVLGAGELGTAVLQALAEKRDPTATSLTVLLRESTINSPDAQKRIGIDALAALGISFLPGDLAGASEPDLIALFAPCDTIVSCTGFAAGRGAQLKLARCTCLELQTLHSLAVRGRLR